MAANRNHETEEPRDKDLKGKSELASQFKLWKPFPRKKKVMHSVSVHILYSLLPTRATPKAVLVSAASYLIVLQLLSSLSPAVAAKTLWGQNPSQGLVITKVMLTFST